MNQELTNNPFNPLASPKVFDEIKRTLSATERSRFNHYMNDRRRRMADAVTSSQGLNFYDVTGGAGTINLYCRNSRPI